MIELLKPKQLYTKCDTSIFDFKTTKDVNTTDEIIGQNRALEAIKTALGIDNDGYNLFIMGQSGTGRHSLVDKLLKKKALNDIQLYDWCYVNNFKDYAKPTVIKLPTTIGSKLKKDMEVLIKKLQETIPETFKKNDYLKLKKDLQQKTKDEQDKIFYKLKEEAKKDGVFINDTNMGVTISPLKDGKTLTTEEFQSLNINEREKLDKKIAFYKIKVDENSNAEIELGEKFIEKMKEVDTSFIKKTVSNTMKYIKNEYKKFTQVSNYLSEVEDDIVEHFEDFIRDSSLGKSANPVDDFLSQSLVAVPNFDIYNINLFVDNSLENKQPIVYENNPTYSNLFGRIEHINHMGTLTTDFNLIKAGSLHKANGGYLIIDARALLFQPYSWEGLKRAIQSKEIHLETIEESMGFTSSVTLNPQSIELDVKIVLIGSRYIYYFLYTYDDEFKYLFKIEADFEDRILKDNDSIISYSKVIATIIKKNKLLPLTKKAVAKIIEYSSRLVDESNFLSMNFSSITDLLFESNLIAKNRDSKTVKKADISDAITKIEKRRQRVKEEIYDDIQNETILIDTKGSKVGQINGLTIIDFSNYRFSIPVKISALTRVGKGGVIDIEREVDLSGPIHSKGVMILSSLLASRYSHDFVMSLSATLTFEQSYSMVEGDSASLAEFYALLSSISNIPIKQNFAVTGSINQHGEVQAIGGVNEKIEGFFDVCKLKDEDFNASVIIPQSNVKNLMLKEELLEYVKNGQFKVYAISNIDEGIELLMGVEAGKRDEEGNFPKNSLNHLVEAKLKHFTSLNLGTILKNKDKK